MSTELLDAALLRDLESRFGRGVFITLIEAYLGEVPLRRAAITAAMAASDLPALQQQAHDLTTSSGTLGVKAVHAVARDIEVACRAGRGADAFALATGVPD